MFDKKELAFYFWGGGLGAGEKEGGRVMQGEGRLVDDLMGEVVEDSRL